MQDIFFNFRKLIFILVLVGCSQSSLQETKTSIPELDYSNVGILDLQISLDKNIYHLGDNIEPIVKLRNIGQNNLLVRNRFSTGIGYPYEGDVNIEEIFLDPMGKNVDPIVMYLNFMPYSDNEFQVLPINEEFSGILTTLNLNYKVNKLGKYSYMIKYKNHLNPKDGRKAWNGVLSSNVVFFEIIK